MEKEDFGAEGKKIRNLKDTGSPNCIAAPSKKQAGNRTPWDLEVIQSPGRFGLRFCDIDVGRRVRFGSSALHWSVLNRHPPEKWEVIDFGPRLIPSFFLIGGTSFQNLLCRPPRKRPDFELQYRTGCGTAVHNLRHLRVGIHGHEAVAPTEAGREYVPAAVERALDVGLGLVC